LAWVAEVFAADPAADVVYHNARIVKDGQIDGVYVMGQADQTDMLRQLIFKGNNLATLATCFRKKLIDSVGYFSEEKAELHLVEDYDLWLRMAAAGCKFVFLPQILADYVMHDSNYSAGNIELMCRSELFVLERHYQALKNKHRFDWYRFRRRRGQILAFAAYRFLLAADRPNSYRYLVKAVAADPLTMVLVAKRLLNRAWRRIFSKGAIG
jgi:GT2 family glycosyltransferase